MRHLAALLVSFLAGAVTVVCSTQGQKPEFPLLETYTPTRLEWLALDLQANYRTDISSDNYYSLNFVASGPDTITILVEYADEAPAGIVDRAIDTAKYLARKDAESNGWSKWLKIKIDRHHTSLKQKEGG